MTTNAKPTLKTPRAGERPPEPWRVVDLRLPSRELRTPRVALRVERDGLALIVLARRRRREG
ncbi:MAG: hypothetical protein N2Z67_03640, partial [Acetobacteraceae bacterium]|nr:hypothetical protein [Acetobacteraceae bacterium]